MGDAKQTKSSYAAFFALTFLLSAPLYMLNALAERELFGMPEMSAAYIVIFTLMPAVAAVLLTWRARGSGATKGLLLRVLDYRRIGNAWWLLPTVLLGPAIFAISLGTIAYLDVPVPPAMVTLWAFPVLFAFVFLLAAGEEAGWMGYAFNPMQTRFGALCASIFLGAIWAIWHAPFFVFLFPDPIMFAAELVTLIAARILLVWVFLNAGRSVFIATLYHAADNAAFMLLPDIKSIVPLGSVVHLGFTVVVVCLVAVLWDPTTMTRLRFCSGSKGPE